MSGLNLPDLHPRHHVVCERVLQLYEPSTGELRCPFPSRLPSSTPLSASTLPDAAKRMLLQFTSRLEGRSTSKQSLRGEERDGGSDRALRFGGIWNKLERGVGTRFERTDFLTLTSNGLQRTLASPLPHLQFLLALSALNPSNASAPPKNSSSSSRFPSMPPPPLPTAIFPSTRSASPTAASSRLPLQDTVVTDVSGADWKGKGKSKADVLKAWRTFQCTSCRAVAEFGLTGDLTAHPPFPTHLLLRDTLYLLQGIDGRYVRFAIRPPKELNPYLTDSGKAGDGVGFALGKDGGQVRGEEGKEGEVVGIDIVADEPKVCCAFIKNCCWAYPHAGLDG